MDFTPTLKKKDLHLIWIVLHLMSLLSRVGMIDRSLRRSSFNTSHVLDNCPTRRGKAQQVKTYKDREHMNINPTWLKQSMPKLLGCLWLLILCQPHSTSQKYKRWHGRLSRPNIIFANVMKYEARLSPAESSHRRRKTHAHNEDGRKTHRPFPKKTSARPLNASRSMPLTFVPSAHLTKQTSDIGHGGCCCCCHTRGRGGVCDGRGSHSFLNVQLP